MKKPKNQNFEKKKKKKEEKKIAGDIIILHMFTKNHNILGYFSYGDGIIYTCETKSTIIWCMLTQIWSATYIIFCHFRPIFALLHHYWPKKWKFRKNVKNSWGYYPFTHVYHKSKSCDVWFLRYKVQLTEFFYILGHFLHFHPPNNPENRSFEKLKKKVWRYYHFTLVYHKWRSYDVWFLRYQARQTKFFVVLGYFLPFYPPNNPENQNFEKTKKFLEILSF